MSKIAFIIPSYQHSTTLDKILQSLQPFQNKVFVVDDGSDTLHRERLQALCNRYSFVELIHHAQNQGKGAACITGFSAAFQQGYTHGFQIDSDGQHDLLKIEQMLKISSDNPEDLVSGLPQYDESVPKSRLYGRYITHFWVWIETLSFDLKDSMCGFRIYPLDRTLEVCRRSKIGRRMDFDTEIMVRLYWAGVQAQFVPVSVIYPENGISHFDVWKDNVRISKMHSKLFFAMLPRAPGLLWRKFFGTKNSQPWFKVEELGSVFGIRLLLLFYKLTGRKVLNVLLYPIALYYSLTSSRTQLASIDFQRRVEKISGKKFSTFEHVYSFASTAIDRFAVWFGDIKYSALIEEDVASLLDIVHTQKGAFFLSSHYGNIEVCRALGRFSGVRFNALVYYENAKKFNSYLNHLNPESNLNIISVENVGPDLAIAVKEKLDQNEWIFIMGDRQSAGNAQRTRTVSLLGAPAEIPEGALTMAYVMDVPIYVIHCFRLKDRFRIQIKPIEIRLERRKAHREQIIQDIANQYAAEVERVILQDPLQWYNFFNFWSAGK